MIIVMALTRCTVTLQILPPYRMALKCQSSLTVKYNQNELRVIMNLKYIFRVFFFWGGGGLAIKYLELYYHDCSTNSKNEAY